MIISHGRRSIWIMIILLLVFQSVFLSGSQARDFALVTAVYDGDTIRVRLLNGESETVRLIGINSPEMDDPRDNIRLLAGLSKRFVFIHLYNRRIELIYDWERRDRYGRLLAFVQTPEGLFNQIILESGFSSVFLKYPFRDDYRNSMIQADRNARNNRYGIWWNDPYPQVEHETAGEHYGRLCRIQFRCESIRVTSRLMVLSSPNNNFSVVVYREDLSHFPDLKKMQGRVITASGLIEEYQGHPQMVLFSPLQLETQFDK